MTSKDLREIQANAIQARRMILLKDIESKLIESARAGGSSILVPTFESSFLLESDVESYKSRGFEVDKSYSGIFISWSEKNET